MRFLSRLFQHPFVFYSLIRTISKSSLHSDESVQHAPLERVRINFFQNLKKTKLFMALKFQLEKTLTCFWRGLVIMFREQHTRWKKDGKCYLRWYQVAAFWRESALNLGSRSKFSSPLALTAFLKLAASVAPKANVVGYCELLKWWIRTIACAGLFAHRPPVETVVTKQIKERWCEHGVVIGSR